MSATQVRLGLRENAAQFSLLVLVNAFVGAMVGLERSTLPLIGRESFHLASSAAVLSFIVAFGIAKALTNLTAGALAQRAGRRRLLIAGWAAALPVPLLIALAPSWGWIVAANALLGINQGLAWSMTVVMKIDLVGPRQRGLALGLNESAGYGGVALAAGVSGWLAASFAARDVLVVAGAVIAIIAFLLSVLFVRDTGAHVALEQARHNAHDDAKAPSLVRERSRRPPTESRHCAPARKPGSSTTSTTASPGAWSRCTSPPTAPASATFGLVAALYPGVWSVTQIATGHWSDHIGRKPLIVAGMLIQAAALGLLALSVGALAPAAAAAVLLGLGTALVYPTLIAAISDAVTPVARAPVVGVYRFWRDSGYVFGGLIAGTVADALGYGGAITIVAALTAASGLWVLYDMPARRPTASPVPDHASPPAPETITAHTERLT